MPSNRSGRSSSAAPDLAYIDIKPILAKFGSDLSRKLILVGGQSTNFWADYYGARVPALLREGPLASKDIDFQGDSVAVRLCADRLGGKATVATMDDLTISTGIVVFVDDLGVTREIDFVEKPHGLTVEETRRTAMPFEVEDVKMSDKKVVFWAMHPVLCMESRIHNTMSLPNYDTPHALRQLRASVICAREFLFDLLFEYEKPQDVLDLNERIFRFATRNINGKHVAAKHDVEPFDAVLVHEILPEMFRTRRFPQMKNIVE